MEVLAVIIYGMVMCLYFYLLIVLIRTLKKQTLLEKIRDLFYSEDEENE